MIKSLRNYCLLLSAWLLIFVLAPRLIKANTNPQILPNTTTASVPGPSPTTGDTTAPTNPILIRPTDGTITSNNKPEFVWTRSTDPNGNYVSYTLFINGVATYLGISNIGNSAGSGYTASIDGAEIKLIPTSKLEDGIHSWYVTANDLSNNTSLSTTWHFTIDTTAPPLTIIDLDTFHNPTINEGSNFDIEGPKDVNLTIQSDPFVSIQLTLSAPGITSYYLTSTSSSSGLSYLSKYLTPGVYTVTLVGIDQAGNITVLPNFTLTITQAEIIIPIPPIPGIPELPPEIIIPYTPITIPSLPATVAKIATRETLPYIISTLLAIMILLLLIILWKRRYNLVLLNSKGQPIDHATLYHSIPTDKTPYSPILVTKREPISYQLTATERGRLYIPHLTRYSTFTIRLDDMTYVLSLSVKAKLYSIVLG